MTKKWIEYCRKFMLLKRKVKAAIFRKRIKSMEKIHSHRNYIKNGRNRPVKRKVRDTNG